MGMKKKLSLGVASAALGLALVGGGTWAAFNDIKSKDATFASGTLDLSAKENYRIPAAGEWRFSFVNTCYNNYN